MTGPITTSKLEVEFIPGSGTWVDLSSRCSEVNVVHPETRQSPDTDTTPTTITAVLSNFPDPATGFSPLTPGSPLSPYWPNIQTNRRVRLTAIVGGATTYVRFLGWVDKWTPDAADGDPGKATVTLTGSCILGQYARTDVLSHYAESYQRVDVNGIYYPFNESPDSSKVHAVTRTQITTSRGYDGTIIQPRSLYPGSATLTEPDGGHLTDGQIDFSRGDDNTPAPVVVIRTRTTNPGHPNPRYIAGWYKLQNDPKGSTGDVIISAYNRAADTLWTFGVKIVAGTVVWNLSNNVGTSMSFLDTGGPRDEGWHYWAIDLPNATNTNLFTRTKGETGQQSVGSFAWAYDPRDVWFLTIGGKMPPTAKGKQRDTFLGSVSSLFISYLSFDVASLGNPGCVFLAGNYRSSLTTYTTDIDALVGGAVATPTSEETAPVMVTTNSKNLLDRWNELANAAGGVLATQPDGRRRYLGSVDTRPLIPWLVLDASADLHMPANGWAEVVGERPTRITVQSPEGTDTIIDAPTEALTGLTLNGPTITSTGTLDSAKNSAWDILIGSAATLTVGIDVTLMSTDKSVSVMTMMPNHRVRIQGLPSALLGQTWRDYYLAGWTESYIGDGQLAGFVLVLDPADDPPEGRFDDAYYGRFTMNSSGTTVTGGTCVGNTGTGTIIITTGSPLGTTAGNFPMDLDWNGERITISGVGGSTSPQTCTVTARGLAPSVARVHAAGEVVQVYLGLRFGY